MQQPSPLLTDFDCIRGQLTLAQLINEIELLTGSPVEHLLSGRRNRLVIYRQDSEQLVDTNLIVDAAVAQREADSIASSQARNHANVEKKLFRVKPRRALRVDNIIYFHASFYHFYSYSFLNDGFIGCMWRFSNLYCIMVPLKELRDPVTPFRISVDTIQGASTFHAGNNTVFSLTYS